MTEDEIMQPLYDIVKNTTYKDRKSYSCIKEFKATFPVATKPKFMQDPLPPQWVAKKK